LFSGKEPENLKNPQVGTHLLCLLRYLFQLSNSSKVFFATLGAKAVSGDNSVNCIRGFCEKIGFLQ
jgi:hypothetical protein